MIRDVFFDLDDTIFDFTKAERNALSATLRHFNVEPNEMILKRYSEINLSQWKLLEQGVLTREQIKTRRYELLFAEFNINLPPKSVTAYYESQLSHGHFFIEGAQEILKKLYPVYRLFLVSNGSEKVQKGRIESSKISKYFNRIFISEKIGYNKPDARFFAACFKEIPEFDAKKAIIVGDSLSSDIQGGIHAGIKTVWFNSKKTESKQIKPDFEISALSQLEAVLKNE